MSENTSQPADDGAPKQESHGRSFEDYRKKVLSQLSELGTHVDGIQTKLTHAATQVRGVIEKELADIKAHHPDAFAKLDELKLTGDEGLDVLRSRLDKLAGDLERAVGNFLGSLSEQAKRATGGSTDGGSASSKTEAAPASAPPAQSQDSDKPAGSS
jgi:hypothetical protein